MEEEKEGMGFSHVNLSLPPGGRFPGVGKEEKRGTRPMTLYLNVSGEPCWLLSNVTALPVYCLGGTRSL